MTMISYGPQSHLHECTHQMDLNISLRPSDPGSKWIFDFSCFSESKKEFIHHEDIWKSKDD